MKTKRFVFVGLFIIAVAMISNLNWAMSDYGIRTISLNPRVLAQESFTAGPNDSIKNGNKGDGTGFDLEQSDCVAYFTGKANASGKVLGLPVRFDASGNGKLVITQAQTLCLTGGRYSTCNQMTCGEFWLKAGGVIYDNDNDNTNNAGAGTSIDKKDNGTN